MELTPTNAALMAQVIPTLLVVVALEPRLRGPEKSKGKLSRFGKWVTRQGRESAVVSSIVSVFLCLYVVFDDNSNAISTFFVIGSTAWLIIVLLLLFAVMFAFEDSPGAGKKGANK